MASKAGKRPSVAPGQLSKPAKRSKAPPIKEPEAGTTQLGQGAAVDFQPQLFPPAEAAALLAQLQEGVRWQQREIRIMGRPVMQPRLIAYQADDEGLQYTYSGATLRPEPWSEPVLRIKEAAERASGAAYNSCLLNYYRDGSDHISWHSDNERLYGEDPTIASVSLGAPREFLLRRADDPSDKYRFWLGGGALLVMRGALQRHWLHSVPRRRGREGARISLTFRTIVEREQQRAAAA